MTEDEVKFPLWLQFGNDRKKLPSYNLAETCITTIQNKSYKLMQPEIQVAFMYLLNLEKIRLTYKRRKGTT